MLRSCGRKQPGVARSEEKSGNVWAVEQVSSERQRSFRNTHVSPPLCSLTSCRPLPVSCAIWRSAKGRTESSTSERGWLAVRLRGSWKQVGETLPWVLVFPLEGTSPVSPSTLPHHCFWARRETAIPAQTYLPYFVSPSLRPQTLCGRHSSSGKYACPALTKWLIQFHAGPTLAHIRPHPLLLHQLYD